MTLHVAGFERNVRARSLVESLTRSTAERVRRTLPRRVKRTLARSARVMGYDYAYPSLPGTLRMLREWGYRPNFLVDVGAFEGHWTRAFREFFPDVVSLMVEPQTSKAPILRGAARGTPARTFVSSRLLGPMDGVEVDFYEMQTGSSVMSELTPYPRTTVRKTMTRLDTLLADFADLGRPDFLKLDVQGYELAVLDGAPATLDRCPFVFLEVALAPYNEGAPLIAEVMAYMDERAFVLLDICSQMRRADGLLHQVDLLFMHRSSPYIDLWSHFAG